MAKMVTGVFVVSLATVLVWQIFSAMTVNFLQDLEKIEKEMEEDHSDVNANEKQPVKAQLSKFYEEICSFKENIALEDYFTPSAKLNYGGQALTLKSEAMQESREDLFRSCVLADDKIKNVQVRNNTALALVAGKTEADSGSIVEALELTRVESVGWRIDAILIFAHVDSSTSTPFEDKEEIIDRIENYYSKLCTEDQQSSIKADFSDDVVLNIAGQPTKGQEGVLEELAEKAGPRCHIDDYKIVQLDIGSKSALALVTGHGKVDNISHPFVKVFELRKTENEGWKFDIHWLFIHAF